MKTYVINHFTCKAIKERRPYNVVYFWIYLNTNDKADMQTMTAPYLNGLQIASTQMLPSPGTALRVNKIAILSIYIASRVVISRTVCGACVLSTL